MYSASPSSSTEPPASWLALLDRLDDLVCGNAVGAQLVGIEHDLVLAHHAADASPPRRRSATVFSSYLRNQSCSARSWRESCLPAAVDQRVLVDPADAGRVGPERRPWRWPAGATALVQVLQHARARPVRVGAVLEQHVDERVAEQRIAAHGLRARHRQHRGRQRIGDLVLDDLRRLARIVVRMMTCTSDRSGIASSGVLSRARHPSR